MPPYTAEPSEARLRVVIDAVERDWRLTALLGLAAMSAGSYERVLWPNRPINPKATATATMPRKVAQAGIPDEALC